MGKKLLAGVLGGLTFFFWSFVAHEVLPLGKAGIKEIPNEQAVLSSMKANMPEDGLYLVPGLGLPENATREQQSAAMKARMHKVETGPSGLLAYHPALNFSFRKALGIELGTNILQVLLAVILLGQTSLVSFGARWRFITIAGVLAGLSTNISYWNWYGFPGSYTLAYVCTIAMGFVFAGLVAAAIVKPGVAATTSGESEQRALVKVYYKPEAAIMPMQYEYTAIPEAQIPRAADPVFQHLLDTYASETNKVVSLWRQFAREDMGFKPADKSSTVLEIMKHQLLSERRFFAEFIGLGGEPEAAALLPQDLTPEGFWRRNQELCAPRLARMADRDQKWWLEVVPFFDVQRERIWVFWRRVLHTTHHRTQLSVYLRLLGKPVPSSYGPTADVTWKGADPTRSVEAAGRK